MGDTSTIPDLTTSVEISKKDTVSGNNERHVITEFRRYNTLNFREKIHQRGDLPLLNGCVMFFRATPETNVMHADSKIIGTIPFGYEVGQSAEKITRRLGNGLVHERIYQNNDQMQYLNNKYYKEAGKISL